MEKPEVTFPPVIHACDVCKAYKKAEALCAAGVTVKKGEIFGLIGPDGAGKSTFLHIIAGVLRPDKGKVSVLGRDVLSSPESIKSSIGFLPQGLGLALAAELSVEENIDFFAAINRLSRERRESVKELLLEKTQLKGFRDRQAKNLSGGMKQKLALCCTLIHEPPLVFLDEPTTGVDPISRRDLWQLVNNMVKEKGLTVFLTTSYMDEAARCHRVALMHKGRIIEEGYPDDLLRRLDGKVARLETDDQTKAIECLRRMPSVQVSYPMGGRLNFICSGFDLIGVGDKLKSFGVRVSGLEPISAGIEDLFLTALPQDEQEIREEALDEFFHKEISKKDDNKIGDGLVIKAESLEKKFGSFTAVNKINFSVKKGEIFGFLGPNGAGKTTTIKMLCGLFAPSSGKGSVAGLDLAHDASRIKWEIGYMSQRFSLYKDLTVSENIELYGGIYGVRGEELKLRRNLILEIADLSDRQDMLSKDLPMGIKQRLALGCSIIHKPSCVFLDEPTSGVDPIARRKFWDIIFLLSRKMGVTVLVTTHYMDEAERCDRVLLIDKGGVVGIGSASELKTRMCSDLGSLLEVNSSDPFAALRVLTERFGYASLHGRSVHVYSRAPDADRDLIGRILKDNGVGVRSICRGLVPFEDVFVYLCEGAKKAED